MINEDFIKVLYIDLTRKQIRIEQRKDLQAYLGGVGVASKLLEETVRPELDPLDEAQPIIFAIGAASTIYPVVTKTVAMFRSPLTGELGECYAGGRMALTMLLSGYDALVIQGKSADPCYISISRNNIEFKDARALWGMSNNEVGRFIREQSSGGGKRSIIRIGPAGERLSRYACVSVDTYRHFGRLGLGAVFGSKHLKAVSIIGDRNLPIRDFKAYFKVYQDIYKRVTETEIMAKYHDIGTPLNIAPLNTAGGLPTKNLRQNAFEYGDDVSGEAFAKDNLIRKVACTGCPVGCIHIGHFRREFDEGYEYEAINVAYDYELIYALGTFLGIKTPKEILEIIEVVEQMGLDAISAGVVLGWATEALMRGLVTTEQTIVPLAFGDAKSYMAAIEYIACQPNDFYHALAQGADYASDVYGGKDFAMTFAKNEMPGYHTGYGSIVGPAVGARHSHLCNAGYSIDQSMKTLDKQKLVDSIFAEEKERCILNSLVICLFSRKVYDRQTILAALNAIGNPVTNEELTAMGERIYRTKLRIKKALGFNQLDVKLPKRLFETPSMTGELDESVAYELIAMYQKRVDELMAAGEEHPAEVKSGT